MTTSTKPHLSIWWALQATFWYWWDYSLPLLPWRNRDTAWWFGFSLRDNLNSDALITGDDLEDGPRVAVSIDVSYWET